MSQNICYGNTPRHHNFVIFFYTLCSQQDVASIVVYVFGMKDNKGTLFFDVVLGVFSVEISRKPCRQYYPRKQKSRVADVEMGRGECRQGNADEGLKF